MLIVSGKLFIVSGQREAFLAASREAMAQARSAPGCRDFIVAADPIDEDRVNIYEEWESEAAVAAFRGEGPGEDLSAMIAGAEVTEHVIASSRPA
jgi:quinol monooxygenase YgiN